MANLDEALIPSRFLTLLSHLTITTTIFLSREQNIRASLPLEYTLSDFDQKDVQLKIGLSLTLIFIFYELICFVTGISMFKYNTTLVYLLQIVLIQELMVCFAWLNSMRMEAFQKKKKEFISSLK